MGNQRVTPTQVKSGDRQLSANSISQRSQDLLGNQVGSDRFQSDLYRYQQVPDRDAFNSLTEASRPGKTRPLFRGLSHELQADAASSGMVVQAKMTVRPAGDRYEQEADRVAAQVVKQIHATPVSNQTQAMQSPVSSEIPRSIQPKAIQSGVSAEGVMAVTPELESSISRARSGGQTLPDTVREPMEQALGADFSGVRVHTDGRSDALNRAIQARAFTTGQDVFFQQGAYQPGSHKGQEVIAHELTHVVQQRAGANNKMMQCKWISDGLPKELKKWEQIFGDGIRWYLDENFKEFFFVEEQSLPFRPPGRPMIWIEKDKTLKERDFGYYKSTSTNNNFSQSKEDWGEYNIIVPEDGQEEKYESLAADWKILKDESHRQQENDQKKKNAEDNIGRAIGVVEGEIKEYETKEEETRVTEKSQPPERLTLAKVNDAIQEANNENLSRNERFVKVAQALKGYLFWRNKTEAQIGSELAPYMTGEDKNRAEKSKKEGMNTFFQWLIAENLDTVDPISNLENATMNCWEYCMYAAYKAGLVDRETLRSKYLELPDQETNMVTAIHSYLLTFANEWHTISLKGEEFSSNDESYLMKYAGHIDKKKGELLREKYRTILGKAESANRGQLVVYKLKDTIAHFALSLGNGRLMSLNGAGKRVREVNFKDIEQVLDVDFDEPVGQEYAGYLYAADSSQVLQYTYANPPWEK